MTTDTYQDPLAGRYASKEMKHIFSDDFKFQNWRKCWTALAESQMELGHRQITSEMIEELRAAQTTIDYDVAGAKEKEIRHDVMAHVHEYGTHCPTAKAIIHNPATSMFVDDNTVLMQQREAMKIVKKGLVNVIYNMAQIAEQEKDTSCLGFTHYQPAQPTTIGKRMTLYIQDLLSDLDAIESIEFLARGAKGATGTQAGFLKLFDGDYGKVKELDQLVAQKLGFSETFPVTGQTYPRKFDVQVAQSLGGIGVSLFKYAVDMRLLSKDKCLDEPFQVNQTGSSAMAYKRNPMRHERICALSRDLISVSRNFSDTAKEQWFERTLDDSAIRRMEIPREFLLSDAVLILANNITNQDVDPSRMRPMTFYPKQLHRQLMEELPFMATEDILVDLVNQGSDRQEMHELIKKHSVAAGIAIKEDGSDNDLFRRLGDDSKFPFSINNLNDYLQDSSSFTGAASLQTADYLEEVVKPKLKRYGDLIGKANAEISV